MISEARQFSTHLHATLTAPSTYFDDIPDPRVDRTKQHLLKDILVITILAAIAGAGGVGRHRKLWTQQATMVRKITMVRKFFRVTQWHPQR
ncbi:transposase family protein [Microcoleus sp. S28C3]|uniref:transposase family protein n=1 Tax=Microcoleus sp. S28C3 TaxID=3055414 RepID=UPI00403F05F4